MATGIAGPEQPESITQFSPIHNQTVVYKFLAPSMEAIYDVLLEGKSLLITGHAAEDSKQSDVGEGKGVVTNDPAVEMEADSGDDHWSMLGVEGSESDISPGLVLSNLPLDRTNRVALRLLRQARASERSKVSTLCSQFSAY